MMHHEATEVLMSALIHGVLRWTKLKVKLLITLCFWRWMNNDFPLSLSVSLNHIPVV